MFPLDLYTSMAASGNLSKLAVSNATMRLTVEEMRQLVFQMGVPLNVLDDIAGEYEGENQKQHYMDKWLNMDPDASWKKVVVALQKINMNALASEIESEHLSRPLIPITGSPFHLSTSSPSVSAPPLVNTPSHQVTLSTPVGSLPPASLTATPAPVGSFIPTPLTASPAPAGSLPPAALSATPAPVGSLPPAPQTATSAPVGPLPLPPARRNSEPTAVEFELGQVVKVNHKSKPWYGVIKYIGPVQNCPGTFAGLEMVCMY